MKAKKTLVFTNFDPTDKIESIRSDQLEGMWVRREGVSVEVKALIKGLLSIADDGDSLRITVELEDLSDE